MNVVNIDEKLALIAEPWQPHIVGQVNQSLVKLVKFKGEFVWHHHAAEDEMFLVLRGTLRILVNNQGHRQELEIKPGEFVIIPRTMDHMPIADEEVHVMLFELQTTLNTGSAGGDRTITNLPRL